jgi:hypothetical protein
VKKKKDISSTLKCLETSFFHLKYFRKAFYCNHG